MGYDLYIVRSGESAPDVDRLDAAEHFGLPNSTMAELGQVLEVAGTADIGELAGSPTSPGDADHIASTLRAFLRNDACNLDQEMRGIATRFAEFCESAAAQGGYVIW